MNLEKKFFDKPNKIYLVKLIDRLNETISKRNLIYINSNYIYLDIPKSASSFIKAIIIKSNNLRINCGPNHPHAAVFKRPKFNNDISNKKIISFIRDPVDRFCSVMREKFKLGSNNKKIKWSPFVKPLKFIRYNFNEVELIIDRLVNSPIETIDKHLLPQSYFINLYSQKFNIEIYKIGEIENKLSSILINKVDWPSKTISLETDKSLFNREDLTKNSLIKLKDFYKLDYEYINNLI